MKPIVATSTQNVPEGNRSALDRPISMVRVVTQSGREIVCAPETLFGMATENGKPVIYPPRPEGPFASDFPQLSWNLHAPLDGATLSDDPRLWYIAGLVMANGRYTLNPSIPARFLLPIERHGQAERLAAFLCDFGATIAAKSGKGVAWKVKIDDIGSHVQVSSRLIDILLAQTCGGFLEPVTLLPRGLDEPGGPILSPVAQIGLLSGLLRGAPMTDEGVAIQHRSASTVRWLHELLFWNFGVPSHLKVNPFEDEFMRQTTKVKNPHTVLVRREHFGFLNRTSLVTRLGEPGGILLCYLDPIASCKPCGEQEAIEIHAPTQATVIGGFVFDSEFELSEEALKIASMDEVFAEVTDPELVLATQPPLVKG